MMITIKIGLTLIVMGAVLIIGQFLPKGNHPAIVTVATVIAGMIATISVIAILALIWTAKNTP